MDGPPSRNIENKITFLSDGRIIFLGLTPDAVELVRAGGDPLVQGLHVARGDAQVVEAIQGLVRCHPEGDTFHCKYPDIVINVSHLRSWTLFANTSLSHSEDLALLRS